MNYVDLGLEILDEVALEGLDGITIPCKYRYLPNTCTFLSCNFSICKKTM